MYCISLYSRCYCYYSLAFVKLWPFYERFILVTAGLRHRQRGQFPRVPIGDKWQRLPYHVPVLVFNYVVQCGIIKNVFVCSLATDHYTQQYYTSIYLDDLLLRYWCRYWSFITGQRCLFFYLYFYYFHIDCTFILVHVSTCSEGYFLSILT